MDKCHSAAWESCTLYMPWLYFRKVAFCRYYVFYPQLVPRIAIIGEIWLIKMRICGTNVPLTTGHLPIVINAVILYDYHSLSNETRSLPGSGALLMICKA
jgi:hypothetical protein